MALGKRAQGSLEYIILIGGVVIIAAASYFLVKGFLSSSRTSVNDTMNQATQVTTGEFANMEEEWMP